MLREQVGPFARVHTFADNFVDMLILHATVYELMDWMEAVNLGMADPGLPEGLKCQVNVDYEQIQEHFNKLSGLIACG